IAPWAAMVMAKSLTPLVVIVVVIEARMVPPPMAIGTAFGATLGPTLLLVSPVTPCVIDLLDVGPHLMRLRHEHGGCVERQCRRERERRRQRGGHEAGQKPIHRYLLISSFRPFRPT